MSIKFLFCLKMTHTVFFYYYYFFGVLPAGRHGQTQYDDRATSLPTPTTGRNPKHFLLGVSWRPQATPARSSTEEF